MGLWIGVVERCWNSKHPLVFHACILCQFWVIDCFHDVKPIIWCWLSAWDAGWYVALVKAIEEANLNAGGGGGGTCVQWVDTTLMARKYHSMVLGSKVHAAVRMVINRDGISTYPPYDLDSKSGCPVINVLQEKHPASCVPLE
jgi:hypothetical protein